MNKMNVDPIFRKLTSKKGVLHKTWRLCGQQYTFLNITKQQESLKFLYQKEVSVSELFPRIRQPNTTVDLAVSYFSENES